MSNDTVLHNTHEQIRAAAAAGYQWPFAIVGVHSGTRTLYFHGWAVYHPTILTDPSNRPIDRAKGRKEFPLFNEGGEGGRAGQKKRAIARAQGWVAGEYGYTGRWVRNRMGDYVPAEVHKRWPLRDRDKHPGGFKVYSWPGHRSEAKPRGQTREICAAKSKAELYRLMGWKSGTVRWNLGVTGNAEEIATATAKPGTVFWSPLDERPRVWREDTSSPAPRFKATPSTRP